MHSRGATFTLFVATTWWSLLTLAQDDRILIAKPRNVQHRTNEATKERHGFQFSAAGEQALRGLLGRR